jgi:protein TonB
MIRYSNSLLISVFIHITLIIPVLYSYSFYVPESSNKNEKPVCIKLSCVVQAKESIVKKNVIKKETIKQDIKKKVLKKVKKVESKTIKTQELKKKEIIKKPIKPIIEENIKNTDKLERDILEKSIIKNEVIKNDATDKDVIKNEVLEQVEHKIKKTKEQKYIDKNIKKIVELLQENLYYPRRARKRGIEGEVMVKFKLLKNAEITSVEVVSANSEILSRAAIKTIKNLSGKFPIPNTELLITVPINYSLK